MEQQVRAADIAAYLIAESTAEGHPLTQLELQKLLAICQSCYAYEHNGKPLFSDDIEAWDLGPVVRNVRHLYAKYKRDTIAKPETELIPLRKDALSTVAEVLTKFGRMTVGELLSTTHDDVWKQHHVAHGHEVIPVSEIASSWPGYEATIPIVHDDLLEHMPADQHFTKQELDAMQSVVDKARKVEYTFEG